MNWQGSGGRYEIHLHPDVYRPSDDTFLLAQGVAEEVKPGERFLEIGCGAGLICMVAARLGARVTGVDLNPEAVNLTLRNAESNGLKMACHTNDLLEGMAGPWDVVAFNPPYLPTSPDEVLPGPINMAFDGGLDGNAVVKRFAHQIEALQVKPRCILIVHSSLANHEPLVEVLQGAGYRQEIRRRAKLEWEELTLRAFLTV